MTLVLSLIIIFILFSFLAILFLHLGYVYLALGLSVFILILVLILVFAYLAEFYHVIFKQAAPYVRTSRKMITRIIKEFDFKETDKVFELGCGDGRFLRALVKNKKCQAFGYEYGLVPYFFAVLNNLFAQNKVKFYHKNLFKADLKDADYVFVYLLTEQMAELEKKLQQELKPGAIVISNTFKFNVWPIDKEILVDPDKQNVLSNSLYIYKKGGRNPVPPQ